MTTTDLRDALHGRLPEGAVDAIVGALDGAGDDAVASIVEAIKAAPRPDKGRAAGIAEARRRLRRSEGRGVKGARDLMAAARSAVPGYDQLTALADELKQRIAAGAVAVRGAAAETARVRAQIVDDMVTSGRVPDEPEAELVEAQATENAVKVRIGLLEAAAVQVGWRLDEAVRQHHRAAFAVLDGELQSLMATLRDLGDVPLTADEAITSNRVEAFRTAQECVGAYSTIRSTSASLWSIVGAHTAHTQPCQWVRPGVVLEWHPPTQQRMNPDGPRDGDGRVVVERAWPGFTEQATGPWPVGVAHQVEWLIWAAAHDALWAPTPAQLAEAAEEVAAAVSEASRVAPHLGGVGRREPTSAQLREMAANAAYAREVREEHLAREAART